MIEKLKQTIRGFYDKPAMPTAIEFFNKINELVDAVNELQKQIDKASCAILDLATPNGENKALKSIQTEPADQYAEQRKWIGKLCKFRDKDYKDDQWDYGLLQAVEKAETAHIWKTGCFKHNLGHWYDYCEPVKPDDDIIYKGE